MQIKLSGEFHDAWLTTIQGHADWHLRSLRDELSEVKVSLDVEQRPRADDLFTCMVQGTLRNSRQIVVASVHTDCDRAVEFALSRMRRSVVRSLGRVRRAA